MRRKRCAACVGRSRSLPGNQTVDRDRGLPVSYGAHPAQPHRVRDAGLESSETPGLPEPEDRLPDQARLAARLSRPTAQESQRSDGSCVSPSYDDNQAMALGEVPRVDPEARDASDVGITVAHTERSGPERTLGEAVEEPGHDE